MNKRAFNARAKVGRTLARIARADLNAWLYDQAKEYARTGQIGPDLIGWLNWYWLGYDAPQVSLGSMREADRRGWDRRLDEIWAEVQQGLHDTSTGLRPKGVFRDGQGAICVAYPGGRGWMAWEQKVSY